MHLKAIIWDIDGTLVDSEPLHLQALRHVCSGYGVDISDLSNDHFLGVTVNAVWDALHERFPQDLEFSTWLEQLNRFYIANISDLRAMPGAASTIRRIGLAGLRQCAVSNSNRAIVDANLEFLGISDMMDHTVSLDDVSQGKPNPEPYLTALEKLRLRGAEARVVEDSPAGVQSAQKARIPVIGFGEQPLDVRFRVQALSEIPRLLFGPQPGNHVGAKIENW